MNKDKILKWSGYISQLLFLLLLIISTIFYISKGFFALSTKILFITTAIMFITAVVFNWQILSGIFKRKSGAKMRVIKITQFVIIMGILIFFYLMSDIFSWKWDLTSSRLYSFSDETKQAINNFTNDTYIKLFKSSKLNPNPRIEYQETLLRAYVDMNNKFNFEIIDPIENPVLAYEYDIDEIGMAVIEYQGNRVYIKFEDFFKIDQRTGKFEYLGEVAVTTALKELLLSKIKMAYVLSGHGEINWVDQGAYGFTGIFSQIAKERIQINPLNLVKFPVIPGDAGLLIIGNPTSGFQIDELNTINNYMDSGGSVLVLLEYNSHFLINDVLKNMGVFYLKNMIFDDEDNLPQSGSHVIVPNILPTPDITNPLLRNRLNVVLWTAVGLQRLDEGNRPEGYTYFIMPLLQSSTYSYGEINDLQIKSGFVTEDPEDLKGPLIPAYSVKRIKYDFITNGNEIITNRIESRMVVIGDTDFINNLNYQKYGNTDFFLNAVNFLLKRDADITIRAKTSGIEDYVLNNIARRALIILSIAMFVLYLGVGVVIVIKRRSIVKD